MARSSRAGWGRKAALQSLTEGAQKAPRCGTSGAAVATARRQSSRSGSRVTASRSSALSHR